MASAAIFSSLRRRRSPSLEAFLAPVDLTDVALLKTLTAVSVELISLFSGKTLPFQRKNSRSLLHRLEAVEIMRLAACCLQHEFTQRPSMSVVLKVIENVMDIEADLNYSFSNPPTAAAVREDFELRDTATLFASVLSGPR